MTMLKKMIAPSLIAMLGAAGILVASQGAAVASPDNKSYNFTSTRTSSDSGGEMSGNHGSMDDHDGYDDDRNDGHDGGYGDSDGHDGGDHDGGDSDGGDSEGGDSDGGSHD